MLHTTALNCSPLGVLISRERQQLRSPRFLSISDFGLPQHEAVAAWLLPVVIAVMKS